MPDTTTSTFPPVAEPEFRRDRNGFPIGSCQRCGGSGRYSFNLRDLDMCYGCSGSGLRYLVPKHHAAWREAVRAAVRVCAQDLQPGDVVRPWGQSDPITGRRYTADEMPVGTVRRAFVDRSVCTGWSTADGVRTEQAWETGVEFDMADGSYESRTMNGFTMFHRVGVRIDPAPYIARAERGARYLRSRQGR